MSSPFGTWANGREQVSITVTRLCDGMPQYLGRMQGDSLELSYVTLHLDDDERLRIFAGRVAVGSWPMAKVKAERTSIYRFELDIDGEMFEFLPEDPSGFSDNIGAFVDLTSAGRFGLKDRIAKASGG